MKKILFLLTLIVILAFNTGVMAEDVVTVEAWSIAADGLAEIIPAFEEETGIKVELKKTENATMKQNLLLSLNAGTGAADVVLMEDFWAPRFLATGGFEDISERIQSFYEEFVDYKWDPIEMNGSYYGMPWDIGPVGMFYRRDIFEAANLPSEPEKVAELLSTWDKFFAIARLIKNRTGSYMLAYGKSNYDNRLFQNMLQQQGLGYFNEDGEVMIDHPQVIETAKFINRMWEDDLALDAADWMTGWYAAIKTGEIATVTSGAWLGGFLKGWIAPATEGKWGVIPMPAWEEGGIRTANSGGSSLYITNQAKNVDNAWKFVEYALTRTTPQLAMYKSQDLFPSLKVAYESDVFDQADPYFAGQKQRRLFANLADDIKPFYYTPDFDEAATYVSTALEEIALGAELEEMFKEAAEKTRRETGRK